MEAQDGQKMKSCEVLPEGPAAWLDQGGSLFL